VGQSEWIWAVRAAAGGNRQKSTCATVNRCSRLLDQANLRLQEDFRQSHHVKGAQDLGEYQVTKRGLTADGPGLGGPGTPTGETSADAVQ
jgi:hypothetical protein